MIQIKPATGKQIDAMLVELEALLAKRREAQARQAKAPVETYWVQATVRGPFGTTISKVRFDPAPGGWACSLVAPGEAGWNFSSKEHAEHMAEVAVMQVYAGLPGESFVTTQVIAESD